MLLSDGSPGAFGAVRQPGLQVLANGLLVPGAYEAEVLSNNHFASDRFRIGLALSADPARGAAWWAAQDDVVIDLAVSLDGVYVDLLRGAVDRVEIDPLSGVVRLQGRDLSAGLIETRTQETFANRTSSEIATLLASRHGLAADVQATTTPVGRYWELEHDRIVLGGFARATTEWDLLVTLAQYEGFDLWVQGSTLYFQPPDTTAAPAVLWPGDLMSLQMAWALTLAGGVEVTAKSWHSRSAQCFVQTASSAAADGGAAQSYVYIVPNLTPDETLRFAQRRLAELAGQERVIAAEMPGELTLAPRQQILLQGTGTAFDQAYLVDSVERRIDMSHGFTQCLRAHGLADAQAGS